MKMRSGSRVRGEEDRKGAGHPCSSAIGGSLDLIPLLMRTTESVCACKCVSGVVLKCMCSFVLFCVARSVLVRTKLKSLPTPASGSSWF